MVAVLGIDAAWTAHHDSGVALVAKLNHRWKIVAAGSNLPDYVAACGTRSKSEIAMEDAFTASREKLGGEKPQVVAVDMPLSRTLIRARRNADNEVSRRFGAAGCGAHTPTEHRPGAVGRRLQTFFESQGYKLATGDPES